LIIDREGKKKETSERDVKETLRKRITTTIAATFFSHIWGEKGGLAHVASQGSSILRY
jgi:hypothetical protein